MFQFGSARDGTGGEQLHVITSFHLKVSREVLEDNIKIALLNARTRGVAATHILLEGDKEELLARIEVPLAEQVAAMTAEGRLLISTIPKRPSYFDMFAYANRLGTGYVAIANSDILFPVETVERICASRLPPAEGCFALTRWNVTPNGIYIQGMTPSPPWPELEPTDLRRHEQNFFSYDAYVFHAPIAIPPDTADVYVGSLGCDTTLGAVLKASGYLVSNPSFVLRIAHFDAKPRSYRSPSAIADLDRNVDALCSALRRPEAGLSEAVKGLLDENGVLAQGRIWFGHPPVGKFGRALHRAMGATPWSTSGSPTPLKFVKVRLDRNDIVEETFDLAGLIQRIETEHLFLEWELTGYDTEVHAIDALLDSRYKELTQAIKQYPWQAFQAPQRMSAEDFRLYDDVIALFRRTLAPPARSSVALATLNAMDAEALAARMAGLMVNDLEDGSPDRPQASSLPPAVLMIDPDALNGQGHYLPYDLQLQKAATAQSIPTSFLLNKNMDPAFLPPGMKTYRLLDSHSWEIANHSTDLPITEGFVRALTAAIKEEKTANPDRPLIIYMYCGSFEHARLIQEVMANFDGVGAVINLFWLSVESYKSEAYLDSWAHFARTIAKDSRFRLTVATANLQAVLRRKTGAYFDVAPHPSTTFDDGADTSRWPVRNIVAGMMPVVLFPGAMREEKGFLEAVDAVKRLTTGEGFKFKCVIAARSRADTPQHLIDAVAELKGNPLVTIDSRPLSDEQFVDFLASGDVIVLPYKASAFGDRPSGILIDAVFLGRPIVAMEGSWLAEQVSQYGWGEICADSGEDLAKAATRAVLHRHPHIEALRTSREGYIQQNSWAKLVKSILRAVRPGDRRPFPGLRVVAYERSDHISVDETGVIARFLSWRRGRTHAMIDVGAHIGTSAEFFQPFDWMIHCFEPDPANRAELEERFRGASNVLIDPRAVSDKPATQAQFYKSQESTGISALHAFRDTHTAQNTVDVTTIADYVRQAGIDRIDFLKIDVEGFDFSVLKGVPWDKLKPDVIECEYEDAKTVRLGHTWHDVAKFLKDLGYYVYLSEWHPIVRYGIAHDWRRVVPYSTNAVPADSWGNIIAFRVDPGYAAVREAFDACLMRRDADGNARPAVPELALPPPPPTPFEILTKPDHLTQFRNIHAGKRCFVMGNGPSLNKMDLSKLDGEIVFGCNSIFLLYDRIKWRPTYYTCVDSRVLPDRATEISAMLAEYPAIQAFFPAALRDHVADSYIATREIVPPRANIAYFKEHPNTKDYPPFSMFSIDINEHVIQPYTVAITMLQIAMYMGFEEVYLIGCDTSYTIPSGVKKEGEVGIGLTSTQDNDPNHFDPRYFGAGRKWHDPQVEGMIDHYRYAKQVSELKGKSKIFNATVGGNLEVFERVDFDSLFKPRAPKPQAKPSASFDPSAYIRPGQIAAKPAAPAPVIVAASMNGGSTPVAAHAAQQVSRGGQGHLTIFPIAPSGERPVPASALPVSMPVTPPPIPPQPVQPRPAAPQAPPEPARTAAPAGPAPAPRKPSSLGERVAALRSQVSASRALKGAAAVGILAIVAAILLFAIPVSAEMRFALGVVGAMGVFALGGAFFAHRTLAFARRMAAENVVMRAKLDQAAARLVALERDFRTSAAQQSAMTSSVAQRIERHTASSLAALEAKVTSLETLPPDLAALRDAHGQTQARVQSLTSQGANAANELAALKDGQAAAQRERTQAEESLSAKIVEARQAQSTDAARHVEFTRSLSTRLAELGALQTAEASRLSDAIDSVSGQVSELAGRVDEESARTDDVRVRLLETREALDGLDSVTRESVSEISDKLSAIREAAFLDAENRRQTEERIALLEDVSDETTATLARASRKAQTDADAAQAAIALADVQAREESARLADLAARVASLDDFAKQVANDLHVADEALKENLASVIDVQAGSAGALSVLQSVVDADREATARLAENLADVQSRTDAILAEVALLPQLAERIAEIDDFAKQTYNELRVADDDLKQGLQDVGAERQTIGEVLSALQMETRANAEAVVALESNRADVAVGLPLLAERIAAVDDFAKQVASNLGVAEEDIRLALNAADDRHDDHARAFAALGADLQADRAAVAGLHKRVADLDGHVPLLAERIVSLDDFAKQLSYDALLADEVARKMVGDLTNLAGRITSVNEGVGRIANSHAELRNLVSGLQQATITDRKAVADIGQQLAEVAGLSEQVVAETATMLRGFEAKLTGSETRLTTSLTNLIARADAVDDKIAASALKLNGDIGKRIAAIDATLATKADSKALGDLALRLAELAELSEGATGQAARELAAVMARVAALAAESVSLRDQLSGLGAAVKAKADPEALAVLERRLIEGTTAQTAEKFAEIGRQVAMVEAQVHGVEEGFAEARAYFGELREGLEASRTALKDDVAVVAARLGDVETDVAQRLEQMATAVEGQAQRDASIVAARIADVETDVAQRLEQMATAVEGQAQRDASIVAARIADVEAEVAQRLGQLAATVEEQAQRDASIVAAEIVNVEADVAQRLAQLAAAFEEQVQRDVSAVAARIVAVEAAVSQQLGQMTAASEERAQRDASSVAERINEVEADVAQRIGKLGGAIEQQIQDALRASDHAKAMLTRLAQAEQGLSTIAGVQRGLIDTLDKVQLESKAGADAKSVANKQMVELIQRIQIADAKVAAALDDIRAKQQDVGKLLSDEQTRSAGLEGRQKELQQKLAKLESGGAGEVAKLLEQFKDLDGRLANETKQRFTFSTKAAAAQEDVEARLTAMTAKVAEIEPAIAELAETTEKFTELTDSHIQAVARLKSLEDAGKTDTEKLADLSTRLLDAKTKLENVERTSMFDNASWYQRFNRRLQQQQIQILEKEWTRKLSVPATKPTFGYMAARANEIERELDGRLATTVEDVILRTLVARATKGRSIEVLEIGTLFGIGAAIMFDTLKNHYDKVHFTLLDPLEGYYSDGRPDILTGQPVTERVVRRNMARAGMGEDQLRLITRLSTDPAALEEASERLYDVLIIDADHSYAGVKTDFENFGRLVRLGGHIIFDDYGSEDWPDVKAYVDAEIPSADFLAHVGNTWRTSVYRVVKPPPAARKPRATASEKPPVKARKTPRSPTQE